LFEDSPNLRLFGNNEGLKAQEKKELHGNKWGVDTPCISDANMALTWNVHDSKLKLLHGRSVEFLSLKSQPNRIRLYS
jgi:hypothetical protein